MNRWIRCILIVLEVGGGFMGIAVVLLTPGWDSLPPKSLIVVICFCFVYALGILSGLALVEKPQLGIPLSAIYQAMQIPVFTCPLVSYLLVSGLQLGGGWLEGRPVLLFEFGAHSRFFLLRHAEPSLIGVNILAFALFVYLLLHFQPKTEAVASQKQPPTSSNTGQESQVEP
jgi:hypothetical protein